MFYNNSLPEAQGNEESTKERAPSLPSIKIARKWLHYLLPLLSPLESRLGSGVTASILPIHFFCKLTLTQITLYYVSEEHVLNSSFYQSDSWNLGPLSPGDFSTAVNTRSLSVAQTVTVSVNETSIVTLLSHRLARIG